MIHIGNIDLGAMDFALLARNQSRINSMRDSLYGYPSYVEGYDDEPGEIGGRSVGEIGFDLDGYDHEYGIPKDASVPLLGNIGIALGKKAKAHQSWKRDREKKLAVSEDAKTAAESELAVFELAIRKAELTKRAKEAGLQVDAPKSATAPAGSGSEAEGIYLGNLALSDYCGEVDFDTLPAADVRSAKQRAKVAQQEAKIARLNAESARSQLRTARRVAARRGEEADALQQEADTAERYVRHDDEIDEYASDYDKIGSINIRW